MKMNVLLKRMASTALTMVLALSTALSPLPGNFFVKEVQAADYAVKTEKLAQGANVLSQALSKNEGFMNQYVRTDGTSMNVNKFFQLGATKNVKNAGETLTMGTMMHAKNKQGWSAEYSWEIPTQFRTEGYELMYEGNVIADDHYNVFVNANDHWDVGIARLEGFWELKAEKNNDEEAQKVNHSMDCSRMGWINTLKFIATHSGCSCGSSAVSGSVFYLVDKSIPVVKNVYVASDEAGNQKASGFSFGKNSSVTAYMVLEFSEDIRFSDNVGRTLSLNLDAYYTDTNLGVDKSEKLTATLSSIIDNKMIFQFSVPSAIGGKNTSIYISGISSKQEFVDDDFTLKIFDASGAEFNAGTRTVKSYITDITGNALNWNDSAKGCSRVYFDNVAPTLTNISMSGNMITEESRVQPDSWPEGVDKAAVFAGKDDWVSFDVSFSENVNLNNSSTIYAVLNIKDEAGNPIKISSSGYQSGKLSFSKLTITEKMKKAGDQIKIIGFEGLNKVTDLWGNALAAGNGYSADLKTVTMAPNAGICLDVDAPVISTDLKAMNGVYTPYAAAEGNYFTFPIMVNENTLNADLSKTSQIDTLPAQFSIVMDGEAKEYAWYVDTNQQIDPEKEWKNISKTGDSAAGAVKNSFYPAQGYVQYVHIKLDDKKDYNYSSTLAANDGVCFDGEIHVFAKDHAGNEATASFAVKHQVDKIAPSAEIGEEADLSVDYENGTAVLSASYLLTDNYSVKKLIYYWTYTTDGKTVQQEPQTISDLGTGLVDVCTGEVSYEFPFSKTDNTGREGSAALHITVEDWGKQSSEEIVKEFTYDFTKSIPNYTVTTGTKYEPLLVPEVILSEPIKTGSDSGTENTRTVLFIKYGENADGTNNYYVYDPRAKYENEAGNYDVTYTDADLIKDLLLRGTDSSYSAAPGGWYEVQGNIKEDGSGEFVKTNSTIYLLSGDYKRAYDSIANIYGTLEITFVTSQDFDVSRPVYSLDGNSYNFQSGTSTAETFKIYLANNAEYQVSPGTVMLEGVDVEDKLDYTAGETPAVNLDNVAVSVNLKNITSGEENAGYGLELIDYSKSKIEMFYYGSSKAFNGTKLTDTDGKAVEWPLAKTETQTIVIPEGAAREIGWYGMKVTVCTLEGNSTTTKLEQYYFMDPTTQSMQIDSYYKEYLYEKDGEYEEGDRPDQTIVVRNDSNLSGESIVYVALGTEPNEAWEVNTSLDFSRTYRYEQTASQYGIQEKIRVRVYNKEHPEGSLWFDASNSEVREFSYTPVYADEITDNSYGTAEAPVLPLFEGDNWICFEVENTNGVVTTKEVIVHAYMPAEGVYFETSVTEISERTGGLMEVTVSAAVPVDVTEPTEYAEPNQKGTTTFSHYGRGSWTKPSYAFRDDFEYEFWLSDQNGNLYAETMAVSGIDGIAPVISMPNDTHYDTGNVFNFVVFVQDMEGPVSADELMLTFDADYSAVLLGLTGEERANNREQVTMAVPINREKDAEGNYLPWESFGTTNNGIFRTQLLYEGPEQNGYGGYCLQVEIWGTWKHDAEYAAGEFDAKDKVLTFSTVDANGNTGSADRDYGSGTVYYDLMTGVKKEGEDLNWDIAIDDNGYLGIYSTVPYNKIHSYGAGTLEESYHNWAGWYVYSTTAPMIQQDGLYNFRVTDLFGEDHDLELYVYAFENIGIDVTFSETEVTQQDVVVNAQAILEGDSITSITGVTEDGTSITGKIDSEDPTQAVITMTDNGTVTITTSFENERIVPVLNIDRTLEEVSVIYLDKMGVELTGSEISVDGEVTALVQCGERLYGTNGELSYTFPRGSKAGTSYIFEFEDAAGNAGSLKAVLPCDISRLPGEIVDETAPSYRAAIYGMRGEKYGYLAGINNADGTELSEDINSYPAQEYKIILQVEDESDTKIVILPQGQKAPASYDAAEEGSQVENVTLTGNSMIITENADFDLYIIDENDNMTSITGISINKIRKQALEMNVLYEHDVDENGHVIVTATFLPASEEAAQEQIISLDKNLPTKEVDGVERYCYVFKNNGSYTFRYRDEFGNYGETLAQVQSMSTAAAVVQSVTWNGTEANMEPAKSTVVNKDITANLNMNKAISEVVLYKYDSAAELGLGELLSNAPVTVSFTDRNIYVTYEENADYQITVEFKAAVNGRKGYYVLPAVNCIDKTAPTVQVTDTETAENHRSMMLTFATDEDTLLPEDYAAGYTKTHSWMATDNQTKALRFSDKAGNITVYEVTENKDLDVTYLEVQYSATGSDADATKEAINDLKLAEGESFFVKATKAAKVILNNVELGNIEANVWTKYQLPNEAGVHILRMIDSSTGDLFYDNIAAVPKDHVAPVITLETKTVIVKEHASVLEMMTQIESGVTVTDETDGEISDYEVTGYPETVKAGFYTLTYEAQDKAGNVSKIYRTLYVMKEGTPLLKVNGEAAVPYGRLVLAENTVELETVGMSSSDDLLVIKWKEGMKTTAQMKHGTETVENMQFTLPGSGFYTIYVRTQDRVEYVTYLYVEE